MIRAWLFALLLLTNSLLACGRNKQACSTGNCLCYTNEDCGSDICFLGTCQSPGYNIQTVWIDLLPNSALGLLQQADVHNPRDLSKGLNFNITLQNASPLSGSVVAASKGVLSGLISAQAHINPNTPVVPPSALLQQQTTLNNSASFTLGLIPGVYDVTFTPSQLNNPVPPQVISQVAVSNGAQLTFNYPDLALSTVTGVISSVAQQPSGLAGAQVSAAGLASGGGNLLSTTAITDSSGAFDLVFLPGATSYTVTVRPGGSQGNPLVPTMTFINQAATGTPPNLGTIILDEPPDTISVNAQVKDPTGALVSGATVFFDGTVGSGTVTGTFSTNAITNGAGVAQTTLLAGSYQVQVIPGTGQNTAATTSQLCVLSSSTTVGPTECAASARNGDTVSLTVGNKISVSGTVLSHQGTPVSDARIVWSPTVNASRRQFVTQSDANGNYTLQVDPASPGVASIDYSILVEPDAASGQPRHLEYLKIGASNLSHNIQLFASSFVYGYVFSPSNQPLPGVTLAIYTNQGSATQPLLVGLGQSTAQGEFVIPLPTASSN